MAPDCITVSTARARKSSVQMCSQSASNYRSVLQSLSFPLHNKILMMLLGIMSKHWQAFLPLGGFSGNSFSAGSCHKFFKIAYLEKPFGTGIFISSVFGIMIGL